MVALMSGNSAARRHFGFVQVAHCAWADDKATDKSQNSTWGPVSCEQSENVDQSLVN